MPVAIAIRLADAGPLRSLELELDASAEEPLRLRGLRVVPSRVGVGVLQDMPGDPRELLFPPDVAVRSWGAETGDGIARWHVAPGRNSTWQPDAPVEIRYAMPAERYEMPGAVGPEAVAASEARTAQLPAEVSVPRAFLEAGGRRFELELRPGMNRVVLYPEVEELLVSEIMIESDEAGLEIEWVGPVGAGQSSSPADAALPEAIPVDLGTLLRYQPELWRNQSYELFSWTLYPEVLVLDSRSYEAQSRFFKRLAFFVEKEGYRGALLTDAELAGRHGYNAHNYNGEGLAAFYNAADETGLDLTDEEERLREIVEYHGIIRWTHAGYEPGPGGVLAVSRESLAFPTLRELLVSHEAYHGVYYAEPDFVGAVDRLWEALHPDQQRFWRLLLSGFRYDVSDQYLLRNEYHAYLLQQPPASASWYFEVRSAERIARWFPGEAGWIRTYLDTYGGTHRRQAAHVQAELFARTGLVARDVYCLEPAGSR
jgi:hypothetical protein